MASLDQETINLVAATEEEALRRAASLTGLDPEALEVVSSEDLPRRPWQPKRHGFLVARRSTRESFDGSWEVEYRDGSIWLTVYPPKGAGSPVMPEALLAVRRSWPEHQIEHDRLYDIIEDAAGQARAVAEYAVPTDRPFQAALSSDDMSAYLVFGVDWSGDNPLTDALAALAEAGVVHGIDIDRVQVAVSEGHPGRAILVAEGTPAQPGEDARLLGSEAPAAPRIDPDGAIDFSEAQLDEPFAVGEAVLIKRAASPGSEGKTVRGRSLTTTFGRDLDLNAFVGNGVAVSEDGLQLIATITGTPSRVADKIHLHPMLRIPRSIGLTTGNIDFPGNVVVDEDVGDGFTVRAEGDITIKGVALGARLEAGGAVVLVNGMFGRGTGEIVASGFVQASFLRDCTVTTDDDVIVSQEIVRSNVTAGRSVTVGGAGSVVGGVIQAGREISAKVVGTASGIPTRLVLGPLPETATAESTSSGEHAEKNPARPSVRISDRIYPPAQICIGTAKKNIEYETPYCRFIEARGEVVLSPYN